MSRVTRLCVLLLAASWSADLLTAGPPEGPGQDGGYKAPGRGQLLFRRPGPKGKG